MKTLNIYAALLFSIFAVNFSFAQTTIKKETIKVWGNCGMCKTTIEKSAKKAGASAATWNEERKELKVSYVSTKSSGEKIQKAIAAAGYDTQDFTGSDKAYENLPGCCHYDRKTVTDKAEMKCCDNEKCGKEADCCKDMQSCKEKGCCSKKEGMAMKCCADEKCGKEAAACKEMKCCKDKNCCKS